MTFEWPVDRTSWPPLPTLGDSPTDEQQAAYDVAVAQQIAAAQLAVDVLWGLSGRQFGISEHTVRPCRQPTVRFNEWRDAWSVLTYVDGAYRTWPCGCEGICEASGPRVVHLAGPVRDVIEIKINGVLLDPSGYVVENDLLYRRGGPWPHQDLSRPAGENRTWTVTYRRGIDVPGAGAALTGLLGKEILLALDDISKCRLPRTVTTASRNGVTYRAYDPAVIYANGKTGLPEVDLWLATVNPHAIMEAPSVI